MPKSSNSIWPWALIAVTAIGLGLVAQQWRSSPVELSKAILLPVPKVLSDVQFTAHTGASFSTEQFKGKWQVLFFGFTYCPDICPTTLFTLKQVKQALAAQGQWEGLGVTMISVDPKRDTPERLAQYVPYFDKDFLGLTTDLDSLTKFTKQVGVLFIAREPDKNGNYDVDHSASLILINPEGKYAGVISPPHKVDEIVHDLASITKSSTATPSSETQASMAQSLSLQNAWIRPAPPTAQALAAYATVANIGQQKISIVAASSPMFEEIMIHTTNIEGAMASMDHVDALTIAPGSRVQLAPLGTHLMLMEPLGEIGLNDLVPISLELSDGSSVQQLFSVSNPENSE